MQNESARCKLCGETMPAGEEMFKYHGYSGPCPKPANLKTSETEPASVDDSLNNFSLAVDNLLEYIETLVAECLMECRADEACDHCLVVLRINNLSGLHDRAVKAAQAEVDGLYAELIGQEHRLGIEIEKLEKKLALAVEFLEACSPAWLPQEIRDMRRKALEEIKSKLLMEANGR